MTPADLSEKYHPVPLAEVERRQAEGWELWTGPEPTLDDDGRDRRRCNWPQDVMDTDKPHLDYEREWNEVVSGSSNGHFRKTRAPRDVGLGWGDWHLYAEWESYGRRVTPDMVEKKDWVKEISSFEFVKANDPSSITKIEVSDERKKQFAFPEGKEPESLGDVCKSKGQ
ncbi:hypothetical protein F4679DRAFT_573261 [Xylaria curta]|nr:hypothetical protein F4679DRAFT_573261 [Xylaria curta]